MTVTETMPPDPNMLKFLLERRMPEKYREIKEVQHTHNAGALFQAFLKRMDERAKEPKLLEAKPVIDVDVSPGSPDPQPIDNQGLDLMEIRSRIASDTSACIWHAKVLIMPGFYLPMVEIEQKERLI